MILSVGLTTRAQAPFLAGVTSTLSLLHNSLHACLFRSKSVSWVAYEDRSGHLYHLQRRVGVALTGMVSSRPCALANASAATTVVIRRDTDPEKMLCQTCIDVGGEHTSSLTRREKIMNMLKALKALGAQNKIIPLNEASRSASIVLFVVGNNNSSIHKRIQQCITYDTTTTTTNPTTRAIATTTTTKVPRASPVGPRSSCSFAVPWRRIRRRTNAPWQLPIPGSVEGARTLPTGSAKQVKHGGWGGGSRTIQKRNVSRVAEAGCFPIRK